VPYNHSTVNSKGKFGYIILLIGYLYSFSWLVNHCSLSLLTPLIFYILTFPIIIGDASGMYEDSLELIGNTPLVRLRRVFPKHRVYAKLEWYNLGGSVKDRMALYMIEYAEAAGILDKNKVILEATSGNTGIALAMIGAIKGYKVKIIMPESVSVERRRIIRAYGAELVLSPAEKGTAGAIEIKKQLLEKEPEKYVDLDQFSNGTNVLAHYRGLAREILKQMNYDLDGVFVGVGTSGTGGGLSLGLKSFDENIKIYGIIPKIGTNIQGLRNPGESNPSKLFRKEYYDKIIEFGELNELKDAAFELARREGLFVGMSSAAVYAVAKSMVPELDGDRYVLIFPDSGMKYLSTWLYDEGSVRGEIQKNTSVCQKGAGASVSY
jgi:cysteine synthase